MEQTTLDPYKPKSEFMSDEQSEIWQVLEDFSQAIRSGNLDEIMSFYAPHVVAYDMMPPLEYVGTQKYRLSWEKCFTDYFQFPIEFSFKEQKIAVDGDVAFSYGLIYMNGTSHDGQPVENWLRNTTCLERSGRSWKITHDHNSVPLDPETAQGLMDLKPDQTHH